MNYKLSTVWVRSWLSNKEYQIVATIDLQVMNRDIILHFKEVSR